MKNVSVYNTKRNNKDTIVRQFSRYKHRFSPTEDFLQGLLSLLPTSTLDRDLTMNITRFYHAGLQDDWNRVGEDMWLSISKFASNNSK